MNAQLIELWETYLMHLDAAEEDLEAGDRASQDTGHDGAVDPPSADAMDIKEDAPQAGATVEQEA